MTLTSYRISLPLAWQLQTPSPAMAIHLSSLHADVNGWSSPQCSAVDPEHEALHGSWHYCRANNQNEYIFLVIQHGEQVDMGSLLDQGIMLHTPLMEAASTC
ncbi:hypothetical protein IW262DRAFT_1466021 [Armillaria fumosa]|nr:hypothetical protein IW262DRAFT_1466021 [Armillaria fumosa]